LSRIQPTRIERTGIGHYFDSIVISSEVGVTKPDPEIFGFAFSELGLQRGDDSALTAAVKAETIMIGDSLSSDIQGGANFGVDTCWYNPTGHEPHSERPGQASPTHVAGSFDEIGAILGH